MLKKPSIVGTAAPGSRNLFDDFSSVHIRQTDHIHRVGQFLAWHRLFVAVYEQYLRGECGYTGAQPYWDWTLDADISKFALSSLFGDTAFGGNGDFVPLPNGTAPIPGRTGGGCVKNGAFKDIIVTMGPDNDVSGKPRCLTRDFSPYLAQFLNKTEVKRCMDQTEFGMFDYILQGIRFYTTFNWNEAGLHNNGHFAVGGRMGVLGNMYSSSGDPIFYLHHAQLDKIWWDWQKLDSTKRLKEVSGPVVPYGTFDPKLPYQNATLDFPLHLNELSAPFNISISDVMDIKGGPLCYEYA
ncbi:hypothetical protein HK098_006979 [Nowakowskiella sp. JEL0407]|nr:hypothetical protein HK098_006979 [Nowakowskiella sp. JEL0407]